MSWLILFIAGLLEIGWAVGLKLSDGFTKPLPSVLTIAAMVASIFLLAQATRTIPLGTAYAVWTGIGAVGVAIVGMMAFAEPRSAIRIACIFLVVVGIVGLKLFSGEPK